MRYWLLSMKRMLFVALFLLALPSAIAAQTFPIKVHGHPQCQWYVADETPVDPGVTCHIPPILSGQGHWLESLDADGIPCHIHIEPTRGTTLPAFPIYGELSLSFAMHVQFQMFHCSGRLISVWSEEGAFILDAIGEWREYFSIPADPNGVVILTGTYYFDITKVAALHGWTRARLHARMALDDGSQMTKNDHLPFWSMRDPSAPEEPYAFVCDGCGPLLRSENDVQSVADGINKWGAAIVDFPDMMPLAPLTLGEVWNMRVNWFGYGAASGLTELRERRLDMNLHQFNSGTVLSSTAAIDTNEIAAIGGLGDHKIAFIFQASVPPGLAGFAPGEVATVLRVIPITIVSETGPSPPPVNCVQGDWYIVSTSDSYSDWIIVGDHQERTKTTTVTEQRDILTAPANGGLACGPSLQTTVTTVMELQPLPPPPPCIPRGKSGKCR